VALGGENCFYVGGFAGRAKVFSPAAAEEAGKRRPLGKMQPKPKKAGQFAQTFYLDFHSESNSLPN